MTIALEAQPSHEAARPRRFRWFAQAVRFLPIVPTLLFLLCFFIVPVGEILQGGLFNADGSFGLGQFERIARTPVYAKVLWITFSISFLTAAISVLLGYPVAYLLSRLSPRARERWLLWIMLPFWTSYLVKTYAWMLLLSKTGVLSTIALALGLVKETSGTIPSLTGVLVGMVHAMLPLAVMTMLPVMRGIDDRLAQAAETLGAERSMSFFTVILPLSSPGVAAAGLLVFISSLGFFIVPALLGSPRETMIAQLVISSVLELFDMRFAGALSTVLLLCSIAIFLVRRIRAAQRPALLDALGDERFKLLLLGGVTGDFCCHFARHDDHAVHIGHHDIAGIHRHAAASDRHIHIDRMMLRQIQRRTRAGTPDRQTQFRDRATVAHRAIRHHAGDAALGQTQRENRTHRRDRALATAVLHQYAARRRRFNGFALRMIRVLKHANVVDILAGRDVAQRERRADHVGRAGCRFDEWRDALQEYVAQAALEQLRGQRGRADVP